MIRASPAPALRKKQVAACTSCLAIHCFILFQGIKLPEIVGCMSIFRHAHFWFRKSNARPAPSERAPHFSLGVIRYPEKAGVPQLVRWCICSCLEGEMMIVMRWGCKNDPSWGQLRSLKPSESISGETSQSFGYPRAAPGSLTPNRFGSLTPTGSLTPNRDHLHPTK